MNGGSSIGGEGEWGEEKCTVLYSEDAALSSLVGADVL